MQINLPTPNKIDDLKELVENKIYGKTKKQWLLITVIVVFFVLIFIIVTTVVAFEIKYQNKFFPGSRIGDLNLTGLTTTEALVLIDPITEKLEQQEIKIIYKNNGNSYLRMTPAINALNDPDLSRELLRFDNHQTIDDAFNYGRDQSLWHNISQQIRMLISNKFFSASFILDEEIMKALIQQGLSELETIAQNASVKTTWIGDDYSLEFISEQEGISIDYVQAIENIKNNFSQLKDQAIEIEKLTALPLVRLDEVMNKEALVRQVLSTTTPELSYNTQKWTISKPDLSQMLEFQKNQTQNIIVALNQEKFDLWLEKNIATQINVDPQDATIEIIDGKVNKFQAHQEGRSTNKEATYQKMNQFLKQGNLKIAIEVNITKPNIITGDINSMRITEIIGTGHSNFAGSPNNRRHNIKTGADKLHGVLINPGAEFSLIKTLGEIDGQHGYKQELVIKGNKTLAEYGGGLCQIGTTVFRATMSSGLPVTARKNHSYSVGYYLENGLPGTDATIYDPNPDFKFINNTGNYILIQTRIEGDDLYFDFWSTSDGRKSERTVPKTWNVVAPPPTKLIETLDLPVGTKKCSETSHMGIDASFDYIITYADGTKDKTTFKSHYKPWQAVCLIGVATLTVDIATSTDELLIP